MLYISTHTNAFSLHISRVYNTAQMPRVYRLGLTTARLRPNETRNIKLRIICFQVYIYIYIYLTLDIKQLPSSFKNKFYQRLSYTTLDSSILVYQYSSYIYSWQTTVISEGFSKRVSFIYYIYVFSCNDDNSEHNNIFWEKSKTPKVVIVEKT